MSNEKDVVPVPEDKKKHSLDPWEELRRQHEAKERPYLVQPPNRGPAFPAAGDLLTTTTRPAEFSIARVAALIAQRNTEIQKECKAREIPYSNFGPSDRRAKIDEPWKVEKSGNKHGRRQLARVDQVVEATITRTNASLKRSDDEQFDYWVFQALVKLEEVSRLKAEASKDGKICQLPPSEQTLSTLFKRLYGPLNAQSMKGRELLNCLGELSRDPACYGPMKKITLIRAFAQTEDEEVGKQLIDEMMKAEIQNLKLPPGYDVDTLQLMKKDKGGVYNVNPLTNRTHSEWFMLPRFQNPPGPSTLLIRHGTLEQKLIENTKPNGMKVIEGYLPFFMDITQSHPIRWCPDPMESLSAEEQQTTSFGIIDDLRSGRYKLLHQQMRNEIEKHPLGIETNLFCADIAVNYNYVEAKAPLFLGVSNREAVKLLADIFITNELPGRDALILFPATTMKGMLSGNDDVVAVEIMKKVWKKSVFIVKINGGKIRDQDLGDFYWKYWKVEIEDTIEDWGFNGATEFVKWGMQQWNEDGEGLNLKARRGADNDSFFLIYKPKSD